jgi:hypothetical protein
MTLHKITEFYSQPLIVCPNITWKFRTVALSKSFVKQNNVSNNSCTYVIISFCSKLHLSKCSGS